MRTSESLMPTVRGVTPSRWGWLQKILSIKHIFVALSVIGLIYFSPPSPAQAQSTTKWNCYLEAEFVGSVDIWWGHTVVDAIWACNAWQPTCGNGGGCAAAPFTQSVTKWYCYHHTEFVGSVSIWWGHRIDDAQWACNAWLSTCGNGGGCAASSSQRQPAPSVTDLVKTVLLSLPPNSCTTGISDRVMQETMDAVGVVDVFTGGEVSRLVWLALDGICHPCSPFDANGRPNRRCQ